MHHPVQLSSCCYGQIDVGSATASGHTPHCPKNRGMSFGWSSRLHSHSVRLFPARGSSVRMSVHKMYCSGFSVAASAFAPPCIVAPAALSEQGWPVNRTCDPLLLVQRPSTDVRSVKLRVLLLPLGTHCTAGTHGTGRGGGGGGSAGTMIAAQLSNSSPMVRQPLGWPSPLNAVDWPTSQRVAFSCRSPSTIVSQLWLQPDSTAQAPLQCSNKRHQRTISELPSAQIIQRIQQQTETTKLRWARTTKLLRTSRCLHLRVARTPQQQATQDQDVRLLLLRLCVREGVWGGERENKLPDAHTSHLLKSQARKKAPSSSGCSVERVCSRTMYSASRSSSLLMVAFSSTAAASCSPAPPSKPHVR